MIITQNLKKLISNFDKSSAESKQMRYHIVRPNNGIQISIKFF